MIDNDVTGQHSSSAWRCNAFFCVLDIPFLTFKYLKIYFNELTNSSKYFCGFFFYIQRSGAELVFPAVRLPIPALHSINSLFLVSSLSLFGHPSFQLGCLVYTLPIYSYRGYEGRWPIRRGKRRNSHLEWKIAWVGFLFFLV